MAITLNNNTVELSGTVTAHEILKDSNFTQVLGAVASLTNNVLVKDDADLSAMVGVIFDLNGFQFRPETSTASPEIRGCVFLLNGETASAGENNRWKMNQLNLKDCMVVTRATNVPYGLSKTNNVVAVSSALSNSNSANTDSGTDSSVFLTVGGVYSGLYPYYPSRFGIAGVSNDVVSETNRFHLKDINVVAEGAFWIGYNTAPETIFENFEVIGNTSITVDTYLNAQNLNTMVLVGQNTIDSFFNGASSFNRHNAHNNFKCYTAGKRYLNIINGDGLKIKALATVEGVENQELSVVVTRDVQGLLSDKIITVDSDDSNQEITILTGIWDPPAGGLVNYTDLKLVMRLLGKNEQVLNLSQAEAQLIVGSSDNYLPIQITADKNYDTSIDSGSLTGISISGTTITINQDRTLQEVYNYLKYWLAQENNFHVDDFVRVDGANLDLNNYTVVVTGATLSSTQNLNRLTTKSSLIASSDADIQVSISDVVGDSNGTLILPSGFTTASIHNTESDADNDNNPVVIGLNFRYKSSDLGGQVRWVRASGTAGEIVTSVTIPNDAGAHTFEILVTPVDASLARIENKQTTILNAIQNQTGAPAEIDADAVAQAVRIELNTELDRIDTTISSRSTFDAATDEVITDDDSRLASQTDLSNLENKIDQLQSDSDVNTPAIKAIETNTQVAP